MFHDRFLGIVTEYTEPRTTENSHQLLKPLITAHLLYLSRGSRFGTFNVFIMTKGVHMLHGFSNVVVLYLLLHVKYDQYVGQRAEGEGQKSWEKTA